MTFQTIDASASPEVQMNENFIAAQPAGYFAQNPVTTAGLVFGYSGGSLFVDGVLTTIADGTLTLTASQTNYIEMTRAGVVSSNTTGFTAGRIPLYTAVTGSSTITSVADQRVYGNMPTDGLLSKAMPSDANYTLTAAEAANRILEFNAGTTLTLQRNIVIPLAAKYYIVKNNTTGGQNLQFIGGSGTGTVVANGKRAIIYADGTNVVRVTADT
jgi:hypothetical protein